MLQDRIHNFDSLSLKEKTFAVLLCICLLVLLLGVGYFLYKTIVLIFPVLLIGVLLYFAREDDGIHIKQKSPEQYAITDDVLIICESLQHIIGNVGGLLNLKAPSRPIDLYMGVMGGNKLLFKIPKLELEPSGKDLLTIKDIAHVLNEELQQRFVQQYSFFVTTREGLQVLGVQEQPFYYQVLVTPVNNNTRSMILEQLAFKANQPNSRQPKDLSDDF